jgi:hypothetical protein
MLVATTITLAVVACDYARIQRRICARRCRAACGIQSHV